MITIARLKPRNPKKEGMGMRTYTSAKGNKYSVGQNGQPSPVKIVNDPAELEELREFEQFEIRSFEDREALDAFLEKETADAIRAGRNVVKPVVDVAKVRKAKKAAALLDNDDDEDENAGRPAPSKSSEPEVDEERQALVEAVAEMEAKHADAIEQGRTEQTIEKWEARLEEAQEALAAYDAAKEDPESDEE